MLTLTLHEFDLPLRHTFAISRGAIASQSTLVVELSDGAHRGYGEATANSYYGATIAGMREAIQRVRDRIEAVEDLNPQRLWEEIAPLSPMSPSANVRSTRRRTICGGNSAASRSTRFGACRPTRRRNRVSPSASTRWT